MKQINCLFFVLILTACGSSSNDQEEISDLYLWSHSYQLTNTAVGHDFIKTSDGGYVICGNTYCFTCFKSNLFYIKTDAVGELVWKNEIERGDYKTVFEGHSVIETSNGEYISAATTVYMYLSASLTVIKTTRDGSILFDQIFNLDYARVFGGKVNIIQIENNGFFILCNTKHYQEKNSLYILKIDNEGNQVSENYIEGVFGQSIIKSDDGNFLIAGFAYESDLDDPHNLSLVAIDDDGNMLWQKEYSCGSFADIQKDENGDFFIVGPAFSDADINTTSSNLCLYKVDNYGNEIWKRTYDTPAAMYARCLRKVGTDGFVILYAGMAYGTDGLLRIDYDGNEIWNKGLSASNVQQVRVAENGYILLSNSDETTSLKKIEIDDSK